MPELPEVETIRRGLEKHIVGYTIEKVEVRMAKQFRGEVARAEGGKIMGVRRFGKGLVIDLDTSYSIAVHVKMTGQLLFDDHKEKRKHHGVGILPNKYTHGIFHLVKGEKRASLYYNDMRQFGWVHIIPTEDISKLPFFISLGPEPLKDLTRQQFHAILSASKLAIKLVIMDQSRIAGIGNIYANDALYIAKVHPSRPAKSLTPEEKDELFTAIESVLKKGIEVGGASEWHYVDVLGEKGQYQNFFQVYGAVGNTCKRCGTIIEKIKLGGRGTFFCPVCQALS